MPASPTPILSIVALAPERAEGHGGATQLVFIVSRSGDLSKSTTANWEVVGFGGSPADETNFTGNTLPSGKINFDEGQTTQSIIVSVEGDSIFEKDEGFAVKLTNPGNAMLDTANATCTILNDDLLTAPHKKVLSQLSWGDEIKGGNGDDQITVDGGGNTIIAGGGNDKITAAGWNNAVDGGSGDDVITGCEGSARILGGDGDDHITLRGWHNIVQGGMGNDTIDGGQGDSSIDGGEGDNRITVHGWTNTVRAGDGHNFVQGSEGNSQFYLGNGENTIQVWGFNNVMVLGGGDNTIEGLDGNSIIHAGNGNNLVGLTGWNNIVTMGDGDNVVFANGGGNTQISGGDGHNIVQLKGWNNDVSFGDGGNTVWAGMGMSKISTGAGSDIIFVGSSGGSEIHTGAGDDVIYTGGAWNDLLYGGFGDDNYVVRNSNATIIEIEGQGVDTVWVDVQGYVAPDNVEIVRLIGDASELTGSAGNDILVANQSISSILTGGAGDDTLYGSGLDDRFTGGFGNDVFYGAGGADYYVFDDPDWGHDVIMMWGTGQKLDFTGSGLNKSDLSFRTGQGYQEIIREHANIRIYGTFELSSDDFMFG